MVSLHVKKMNKVVIVGVGLIGGSLGIALRRKKIYHHVIGLGRSREKLQRAKKHGAIDEYTTSCEEAFCGADLIVLATPVRRIPFFLNEIKKYASPKTTVIDVGSTKQEIVCYAQKHVKQKFCFIGCHPLAGSEKTGVTNASGDLFNGKLCIITPMTSTDKECLNVVKGVWKAIGAVPFLMSAKMHDQVVAQISHLPHLAAVSLVKIVNDNYMQFAASGFRDMTRIAQSDPEMWRDICLANAGELIKALDHYVKCLLEWKKLLQKKDDHRLFRSFEKIKKKREIINKR